MKFKRIILALLSGFLLTGCAVVPPQPSPSGEPPETSASTAEYLKLTTENAKEMMTENADLILLDVRTDAEFLENRIDGAILIPDFEISSRAEAELPNKDALILIYCRSGRRSALAAQELVEMGYTNVYDFGGIIDWHYDTVSG